MSPRKAVPKDLTQVQTRHLVKRLSTATESIAAALQTFVAAEPGTVSRDALAHVRTWADDAAKDARRLNQTLA
jgi:hypothetical protein